MRLCLWPLPVYSKGMELNQFESIEWFFSSGKEIVGPFSKTRVQEKIRPLVESNKKVFVWKYGNLRWVPAQEVFMPHSSTVSSPKLHQSVTMSSTFLADELEAEDDAIALRISPAERFVNLAGVVLMLCVLTLVALKISIYFN